MSTGLKLFLALAISSLPLFALDAQELLQSVTGTVRSKSTQQPLAGANVSLVLENEQVAGSGTDEEGNFRIDGVSPGRYKLLVSFTGFHSYEDELLVISGKESTVTLLLEESPTMLQEVTVKSSVPAVAGLHSFSIEKTMRIPANFFDPVRLTTSLPGVVAANDGSNAIVVKGYSPNGLLWRLQGLDIVNPNHLANAGTFTDKPGSNGGGVNVLSAQLLDQTDFYTGALPVQYGNALSGVMDMKLRPGNTDKLNITAQASLIGLDVAAEGPFDKNKRTSFLANYRYSTVGILSAMGITFGDEKINFQDFSFHLSNEQKKGGTLSIFGFGGLSSTLFDQKPQDQWEEEKDLNDIDYHSKVYGAGITEQWKAGPVNLTVGTAISGQEHERNSVSAPVPYPHVANEKYKSQRVLVSSLVKGNVRLASGTVLEAGAQVNYLDNSLSSSASTFLYLNPYFPQVKGKVDGILWQPYLGITQRWKYWQIDAGFRYVMFSYNDATSPEPRFSLQRNFSNGLLSVSYGMVGQWQQVQTYLQLQNQELPLTRAHRMALEWRQTLSGGLNLISSAYYHAILDVPVTTPEIYSTLNQMEDFSASRLDGTGKGRNYGVEASVEKKFYSKVYFMVSGSWYKSLYLRQGSYHDTRFSGDFTTSALGGKEWVKKNKAFGMHVRILYLGGLRMAPINVTASRAFGTTVFDLQSGYIVKMPDYFRTDFRVSWRKNKPGYTRTLSLDVQNLFNTQNVSSQYFDTFLQTVKTRYQVGIVPILVYRVEF